MSTTFDTQVPHIVGGVLQRLAGQRPSAPIGARERLVQARADEAFARARELGFEPQPGLAFLRLMQGKPDVAFSGLRVALTDDSPSLLSRTLLLGASVGF